MIIYSQCLPTFYFREECKPVPLVEKDVFCTEMKLSFISYISLTKSSPRSVYVNRTYNDVLFGVEMKLRIVKFLW